MSFLHAANGIGALLGYFLSSISMRHSLQWPFGIAVVAFTAKFVLLQYTPETAPCYTEVQHYIGLDEYASSSAEANETRSQQHQQLFSTILTSKNDMNSDRLWEFYQFHKRQLQTLVHVRGTTAILASFANKRIAFASLAFVFQYTSEVLQQDLSQTFLIRVIQQINVAILFICLLPLLTRKLLSPMKDLWIIRLSLAVLMIGFYLVWNSHSVLGLTFGTSKPHYEQLLLTLAWVWQSVAWAKDSN
jgi:hypothetical protein